MSRILLAFFFAAWLFGSSQKITTIQQLLERLLCGMGLDDRPGKQETSEGRCIGELKLRWLNLKDDFSESTFDLDGKKHVRQKWKNDPSQWELRTYEGDIVTMKTQWSK